MRLFVDRRLGGRFTRKSAHALDGARCSAK
jgi:hypothetical protein